MNAKRRGLGRGLDALLGGSMAEKAGAVDLESGEMRNLPVDMMQRGQYQPRSDMRAESLEDLADSIRAQGIIQPIVVREIAASQYEIIAGERRWRAAQIAGLHEVPVLIKNVPDQAAIAMSLIENIQREDLNPMEEALALQRLISEFDLTHQMAAEAVGRSRAAVSNLLRLFDLNEDVKKMVEQGQLEMGHARALLGLQGKAQSDAASAVSAKGLSVRETEQLVRRLRAQNEVTGKPVAKKTASDPDIERLQEELTERLGASIKFQHASSGRGRFVVQYNNLDELEGILAHIK